MILRILVGSVFIVSGFEKLIHPHENFLYVLNGYEILDKNLAEIVAVLFPWMELIVGVFVFLGLYLKWALKVVSFFTMIFLLVVSQSVFRNLAIHECGCFGELFSVPIPVILVFDSCLLLAITTLRRFIEMSSRLSLDNYFLAR